jgi:hypothetical protein
MNPNDPKRSSDDPERATSEDIDRRADHSFTPPHGDPERAHLGSESGTQGERHTTGLLSELDGGGVRFEPKRPERGIDPRTNRPTAQERKDPPSPAEGETADEKAMDQADEAGSALLHHDKVLKEPKG